MFDVTVNGDHQYGPGSDYDMYGPGSEHCRGSVYRKRPRQTKLERKTAQIARARERNSETWAERKDRQREYMRAKVHTENRAFMVMLNEAMENQDER